MPYMICSWPSSRLGDVGDEVEEVVGLPVEAERVEAPEHEGGVADPGVAVVPVALAARRLGQRGRGRGHHRAGGRVGQALQRQRAALQVGAPRVVGELAVVEPVLPVVRGPHQPLVGLVVARRRRVLGPRQRGEQRVALLHQGARRGPRALEAQAHVGGQRAASRRSPRRVADRLVVAVARCTPTWPARGRSRTPARSRGDLHLAVHAAHRAQQHVVGVVVGGRAAVGAASARPRGATARSAARRAR